MESNKKIFFMIFDFYHFDWWKFFLFNFRIWFSVFFFEISIINFRTKKCKNLMRDFRFYFVFFFLFSFFFYYYFELVCFSQFNVFFGFFAKIPLRLWVKFLHNIIEVVQKMYIHVSTDNKINKNYFVDSKGTDVYQLLCRMYTNIGTPHNCSF